MEEMDKRMG